MRNKIAKELRRKIYSDVTAGAHQVRKMGFVGKQQVNIGYRAVYLQAKTVWRFLSKKERNLRSPLKSLFITYFKNRYESM